MPRELTDAFAALLLPPGAPLVLVAIGMLMTWRGRRRTGTALAILSFLALWLSCLGVVGHSLVRLLEPAPSSEARLTAAAKNAGAIVVLGAGRILGSPEYGKDSANAEALARLRYGARLARKTGLPLLVAGGKPYGGTLSEGETMADALEDGFNVPARWIEGTSNTTAENAMRAFAILQPEGRTRVILVTSASHMRRAELTFRKAGFEVFAAPTAYASRGETHPVDWLPTAHGLAATRTALWEIVGIAWYRLRGLA
jgi:uncharacterized SAM-binding protein YcdF (DUF218 family)